MVPVPLNWARHEIEKSVSWSHSAYQRRHDVLYYLRTINRFARLTATTIGAYGRFARPTTTALSAYSRSEAFDAFFFETNVRVFK